MKMQWVYFVGIIFALMIAVFAVINVEPVKVNYVFGYAEWPLILIIIGSVFIGSLVTALLGTVKITTLQRKIRALEKAKTHEKNHEDAGQLRK